MVPAPPPRDAAGALLGELRSFDLVVRAQLTSAGLPAEQVLIDVPERHTMLSQLAVVLAELDAETLARSHYISKMVAAAAVGLFDAALNYLWDELVDELRRRVRRQGLLRSFFDLLAGHGYERRRLKDESDLARIDDVHLVRVARDLGVLTEGEYRRLDHIRFERNHASAAHPNRATVTGMDLANWLKAAIEVLTAPPRPLTVRAAPSGTSGGRTAPG